MYHITWWMAKFATKKIPCFPSPEPNPLWITTISGVWSRKLGLHTWATVRHIKLCDSLLSILREFYVILKGKNGGLSTWIEIHPPKKICLTFCEASLTERIHASFRNGYYSIEPCNALSFILVQYFTATVLGFTCGLVTSTPVTMSYIPPSESSHFINRNHKIKNDFKENFRQNPFKENKMEPKTIEFSISDFHFVCRTDSKTTFRFPMTFQKTSPLAGGRQGRTTLVSPLPRKRPTNSSGTCPTPTRWVDESGGFLEGSIQWVFTDSFKWLWNLTQASWNNPVSSSLHCTFDQIVSPV